MGWMKLRWNGRALGELTVPQFRYLWRVANTPPRGRIRKVHHGTVVILEAQGLIRHRQAVIDGWLECWPEITERGREELAKGPPNLRRRSAGAGDDEKP